MGGRDYISVETEGRWGEGAKYQEKMRGGGRCQKGRGWKNEK